MNLPSKEKKRAHPSKKQSSSPSFHKAIRARRISKKVKKKEEAAAAAAEVDGVIKDNADASKEGEGEKARGRARDIPQAAGSSAHRGAPSEISN